MELLHGDALDELAWLGDCSIDALVTDPPAGIEFMGKAWDSFKGDSRQPGDTNYPMSQSGPHKRMKVRHGTSSGYKNVDIRENFIRSLTAVFRECLRVMKPGAHGLVWALPRTSHWTATALEDAGFEVRDVVTHHFGTGFPKSLNVGKAIDKAAPRVGMFDGFAVHFSKQRKASGKTQKEIAKHFLSKTGGLTGCVWNWENAANVPTLEQWKVLQPMLELSDEWLPLIERIEAEREVTGERDVPVGHAFAGPVYGGDSSLKTIDTTIPATDAAKQWEGFGTALKPASEHWILVRKPLGGTVAANVLEHGTGALNIDGCRIGKERMGGQVVRSSYSTPAGEHFGGGSDRDREFTATESTGRWPANVALSHSPNCVEDCAPGCPVAELDRQSGQSISNLRDGDGKPLDTRGMGWRFTRPAGGFDDKGGASRFFKVVKWSDEEWAESLGLVNTVGKPLTLTDEHVAFVLGAAVVGQWPLHAKLCQVPSTNVTLSESRRLVESATRTIQNIVVRFLLGSQLENDTLKVGPANCVARLELTDTMTITIDHWKSDGSAAPVTFAITEMNSEDGEKDCGSFRYVAKPSKKERGEGNDHPTVKGIALMRWLVRLITPPGGTVLDPFMGSGTTGLACLEEGLAFVGIEQDGHYFEIASKRLADADFLS